MKPLLGTVVVENIGGGSGSIGAAAVLSAVIVMISVVSRNFEKL